MTVKLNVRLLQQETHLLKIKGEWRELSLLVLRDEHGKVIRVAKSESEEKELRKEWDRYNKRTKTEDLPASKVLRKELALLKATWKKKGFTHSMMFLGIVKHGNLSLGEYRRIEVLKATPWRRHQVTLLWGFFKDNISEDNLEIYVNRKNNLKKVFPKRPLNSPT